MFDSISFFFSIFFFNHHGCTHLILWTVAIVFLFCVFFRFFCLLFAFLSDLF